MAEIEILADGLTKRYRVKVREVGLAGAFGALVRPRYCGVRAVEEVSFRIGRGEIVGFLGPNGAGKTTTIKMLSGLLYPTAGRARVAGYDPWTGGAPFKSRIALVLGNKQQLIWDLPAEETFLLNRAIYGIPGAEYRRRRDELVGWLGIGGVLEKPVRQLSQGERMKCELAAALLHRPALLFLDEPTLGLDLSAQESIRAFVREYRDRHGATIVLTSHYMADVTALAPRVLIINRGRLLYDGALAALVERLAPVKRITLVVGSGVTADDLARFGVLRSFAPPRAMLEVPRRDVAAASARILASLPIADLSITDPPIEEVIRLAFAGEGAGPAPAGTDAAAAWPDSDGGRRPPADRPDSATGTRRGGRPGREPGARSGARAAESEPGEPEATG